MRIILKTVFIFLLSYVSYSQQDAQFTQYMYNSITINPAYAGSRETLSIFGLHRAQWIGLDGAPVTNNISVSTPLRNGNLGLGVSIINEKIGPSDENDLAVDFAYNVKVSSDYTLGLGIKASVNLLNIDFNKLRYLTPTNLTDVNIENKVSPNLGVGFYLFNKKGYFGFSVPKILENRHFDKTAGNTAASFVVKDRQFFYFTAGKVFDLTSSIKFKPSLLGKFVPGSPLQVDLSANFLFNEKFAVGASYRWSAAVSAIVGFQATKSWFIGYAYDYDTTRLAHFNSGSHEIFLKYELFKTTTKVVSPRFF